MCSRFPAHYISQRLIESEYIDVAEAEKLALCLCFILTKLQVTLDLATLIFEDNDVAIAMFNTSLPVRRS